MSTYIGITAYLEPSPETERKLRELGAILESLSPQIKQVLGETYDLLQHPLYPVLFNDLKENQDAFTLEADLLPAGHRLHERTIHVGLAEIDNLEVRALTVPIGSSNPNRVNYLANHIVYPALSHLFAEDLIQIEKRRGDNSDVMANLTHEIMYRWERR